MTKRTIVLNFPKSLTKEPITYKLVKDYDLMINILRAKIKPNEQGSLVLMVEGKESNLDQAFEYLTNVGIQWEALSKGIKWDEERCIHCTECTGLCPSEALSVDRNTMRVSFDLEKCVACEMCITVCPYKAINLDL